MGVCRSFVVKVLNWTDGIEHESHCPCITTLVLERLAGQNTSESLPMRGKFPDLGMMASPLKQTWGPETVLSSPVNLVKPAVLRRGTNRIR